MYPREMLNKNTHVHPFFSRVFLNVKFKSDKLSLNTFSMFDVRSVGGDEFGMAYSNNHIISLLSICKDDMCAFCTLGYCDHGDIVRICALNMDT